MAGGGTGGHIYPALAIAEAIRRRDPAAEFRFVGTDHGLEADLIPRAGYELELISLYGFQRRFSARNVKNVFLLVSSLWDVRRILHRFRPNVVIGTGGYVCGPVLLAAALAGIPTMIQEQNAFPGVTNRILSRLVDKVALGYEEAAAKFGHCRTKPIFTGNPVRAGLKPGNREAAAELFGFRPDRPTVLVTGGSQGARSINRAALGLHRRYAGDAAVQLLHVTGQADYGEVVRGLESEGLPVNVPAQGRLVLPYLHEMPAALSMTDVAVSRSGAIGLAELMLMGIPSILAPYPYAAENHQEVNARALEKRGAAIVIKDAELTEKSLVQALSGLLADPERLRKMAAAAVAMGRGDAAAVLAEQAILLASGKQDFHRN